MDILGKIFPLAFNVRQKDTNSLVIGILIHALAPVVYAVVSALLGRLLGSLVAWLLGLLGSILGLYCTGGIVLSVLRFCNVLKDQ